MTNKRGKKHQGALWICTCEGLWKTMVAPPLGRPAMGTKGSQKSYFYASLPMLRVIIAAYVFHVS
jgi:hypothetical protein